MGKLSHIEGKKTSQRRFYFVEILCQNYSVGSLLFFTIVPYYSLMYRLWFLVTGTGSDFFQIGQIGKIFFAYTDPKSHKSSLEEWGIRERELSHHFSISISFLTSWRVVGSILWLWQIFGFEVMYFEAVWLYYGQKWKNSTIKRLIIVQKSTLFSS